jgi:ABC-2 type transport system ATP-binding protein
LPAIDVAVMAKGRLVAAGTLDQVRGGGSLDDAFVRLVGARVDPIGGLAWLMS